MDEKYERVAGLMADKGVSAYKLCKDTGMGRATMSEWKSGKHTPSMENMIKIAKYFGVSVDYIINGTDELSKVVEQHNESIDFPEYDEEFTELVNLMLKDENVKNFVLDAYRLNEGEFKELSQFMEFIKGKRDGNEHND